MSCPGACSLLCAARTPTAIGGLGLFPEGGKGARRLGGQTDDRCRRPTHDTDGCVCKAIWRRQVGISSCTPRLGSSGKPAASVRPVPCFPLEGKEESTCQVKVEMGCRCSSFPHLFCNATALCYFFSPEKAELSILKLRVPDDL